MRIVIADDHPVVIYGLRAALGGHAGTYEVVGDAADGPGLLGLLRETQCDLVITDFSMSTTPGVKDGLPLMRQLHAQHASVAVLVLTMMNNLALVRGMLSAGVRGVVDKAAISTELFLAIKAIQDGRIYLSESIKEQMREQSIKTNDDRALSTREAEVVRLIAQGGSISEIARQTHRSMSTISQQKRDAMRKLGIVNDKQLHEYARLSGLLY